jgi:RNA ligase (TIGR02306 family)
VLLAQEGESYMSSLIVKVCQVDAVETHPNADKMEIAVVKGWRTCIGKGQFRPGDKCVYFPPDTVLPGVLSDRLNVTKYLQPLPQEADGSRPGGGRIRVARLRGEKSYGLIMACEQDWPVDHDVAEFYGVAKWEPPQPCTDGDAETPHPAFFRYTDIENFRNFPNIIKEGEEVVFTEKLHGKNTRLGYIRVMDESGMPCFEFMCGSHDVRRKEFATFKKVIKDDDGNIVLHPETGAPMTTEVKRRCQFWDCLTENVKDMLRILSSGGHNIVLFGEMIGQGIQDMTYGTKFSFRAFDLMVDGKYLDFDRKHELFDEYRMDEVPILWRGPFSKAKVEEWCEGPTTMCAADKAGKFAGREGIVITPVKERYDFDLGGDGRVILKAVSFAYLERRGGTEFH